MLRVGLTGGLGSGKSTVAALLREHGAHVVEADEVGRTLMEPGQAVYNAIVHRFGRAVVRGDGRLDRPRLAQIAFGQGRIDELNAIVHPAVIAAQQHWMDDIFARDPNAVAVVESALIFEVERDARARGESAGVLADWRNRFDRVIVLTAPDELKVSRYVARTCPDSAGRPAAEADARTRLARQIPDAEKAARADLVIENTGDFLSLKQKVDAVWQRLQAESSQTASAQRLK
jgi:dephospho-CoA kinase